MSPRTLLEGVRIDATTKGFPALEDPVTLADVAGAEWTFEDLQPPILLLRRSALEHNVALMAAYCRSHEVELAPHGKTTMAPQLWRLQLDAGAWGITAATATQASVMRAAGVPRILIANEVTDARSVAWVASAGTDGDGELCCYADSREGVALLEEAARRTGSERPLRVLVELGWTGGRTGCRSIEEALAVAEEVARAPSLELAGVAGYEGTIAHDRGTSSLEAVRAFVADLGTLAERLVALGALAAGAIVTAGGSLYFDVVTDELAGRWGSEVSVVLRSGCTLTHDTGVYERSSPFANEAPQARFRSALEAWGSVLSRPESGLVLLGLGRRDVPWDQGLPRPVLARTGDGERSLEGRVEVVELNDQHAYCRLSDDVSLAPGDLVMLGISHPCTAFDRWRVLPVLDDEDRVVDAIATFF